MVLVLTGGTAAAAKAEARKRRFKRILKIMKYQIEAGD